MMATSPMKMAKKTAMMMEIVTHRLCRFQRPAAASPAQSQRVLIIVVNQVINISMCGPAKRCSLKRM
ncbi:hypothetical protein [uncultured Megasphaera sp.]|uniref:hypothetical protein n=1 Tax=uncultured Megasphaera sp. TaxID=165188 RepID=UPI002606502D|nr:hypothetical protein [uncultured Megasphaera sp.]